MSRKIVDVYMVLGLREEGGELRQPDLWVALGQFRLLHECRSNRAEPGFEFCQERGIGGYFRLHGPNKCYLEGEQFRDVLVEGALSEEVLHSYPVFLSEPVATVLRLGMVRRHPVQVVEDHMRSGRQGDTDAAGNQVADGDPDLRIVPEASQ